MSGDSERRPLLRITERRQFQFDALDELLSTLKNPHLSAGERQAIEQQVNSLKYVISVQGSDGCEFVYD